MKLPNQIDSNFFRQMMKAGWYAEREIVLERFPKHLEEILTSNEIKKFLKEIWYLNIVDDVFYTDEYDDVKYYNNIYTFGETSRKLVDYSEDDEYLNLYKNMVSNKIRNFAYKDGREILIDDEGRIYFLPDSGDLYYVGAKYYEGLYRLIYNKGESFMAIGEGVFINEKTKEKFCIDAI